MIDGDDLFDPRAAPRRVDWSLWRRILVHVRPYGGAVVGLVVLGIAIAAIDVSLPVLTGWLIDRAVAGASADELGSLWGAYAGALVGLAVSVWGLIAFAGRIATGVAHDLRREGFARLQSLSFSYYDRRPIGWLVSRITSDCDKIANLLPWFSLDMIWGPALALGIVVAMFVIEPGLALWVLTIVPPLAVVSLLFQRRMLASAREIRRANARITAAFGEAVAAVRTTKTLVREDEALADFEVLSGEARSHAVRNALQGAIYLPIVMSLGAVGVGFALWHGGVRLGGELTLGTLVAFMQFAALFHMPIEDIARRLAELQSAQAAAERVQSLLDTEPEVRDSPEVLAAIAAAGPQRAGQAIDGHPARIGEIAFEHVSFAYTPGEPVLRDVCFRVRAGQTVALVGETGGGKTTIVGLLARFYELSEGVIRIDGIDHRRRSLQWLQSSLGVVLQHPHLFSGTIADNIRYGRLDASHEQIVAAARLARADRFIERLPERLATEVGEGGARLSTGERQLVALARAVLADPQILVLDEATSSIDTETEALIQEGIAEVLRGRISFVIAHRLSTVRRADLILVVEDGRIVEQGRHAELLHRRGRYAALCRRDVAEAVGRRGT